MDKVRVRFAPSPTGALHIGGVRTALYNYLFARKMEGAFILRIVDTDQTRYVDGAERYIIEALNWLGLNFDESPEKGGDFGPYRQSERKKSGLYAQYAAQLVENGHAYYAYDTEEELANARQKAEVAGTKFKYDALSRMQLKNSISLSEQACEALVRQGAPKVVRIKMPALGTVTFNDEVRGVVRFECSDLDDKVMLKNDGMPTYHLANIVDDYHMQISHVIRGEEWLPSTPTHVLLYEYLGWADKMPQFAHLPLILKPEASAYINKKTVPAFTDKFAEIIAQKEAASKASKEALVKIIQPLLQDFKNLNQRLKINEKKDATLVQTVKKELKTIVSGKLSKRDGDRLGMPVFPLDWKGATPEDSFNGFREWGFLPEAVLNMLALLGWNEGLDRELYPIKDLIKSFSLNRVSVSGARFNFEKAKWFNKQYLAAADDQYLIDLLQKSFAKYNSNGATISFQKVVNLLKPRVNFLGDFLGQSSYFYNELDYDSVVTKHHKNFQKKIVNHWSNELCEQYLTLIHTIERCTDFASQQLEQIIEPLISEQKGKVLPFFRLALSGEMGGPGIYDIMEVLGAAETIKRLKGFVGFCKSYDANPKKLDG